MPNGNEFISDLELEQHLQKLTDRGLMEFTARQCYDMASVVDKNKKRIVDLETQSRKTSGIIAGAGTMIGGGVVALINYFTGR